MIEIVRYKEKPDHSQISYSLLQPACLYIHLKHYSHIFTVLVIGSYDALQPPALYKSGPGLVLTIKNVFFIGPTQSLVQSLITRGDNGVA